jgi:hypothetical protein
LRKLALVLLITAGSAAALFADRISPVLIGHITTCSGLINNYPADSTNWFFKNQHNVVQYFAYILFPVSDVTLSIKEKKHLFINPYAMYSGANSGEVEDVNAFECRVISPTGKVICEKLANWDRTAVENKRVNVEDREYLPYVFANYFGIKQMYPENGQKALPDEIGLYHISLYLNGRMIAMTFFEIKE